MPVEATHKLLLALQDAEVRGHRCVKDVVHACGEKALSSAPRRAATLQVRALSAKLGSGAAGTPELFRSPAVPSAGTNCKHGTVHVVLNNSTCFSQ